ncbi:hypothetical protein KFL_001180290 [Klebsormidium nitens]|uniref:Uncharacterized protein n=1 Tax=Klebsormidium nitens TaxID=105231 RepID=A0A1Y1HVI9_KLENI|nr:hypothetical protein KFL_001180290 [Klebsormidium nitens]|eukprot:GAQ82650.1 hypothetical protein KFL_001180290 [Klebsormidium nitens]
MADGPVKVPLYSLPLPAFKAAIHDRICSALPGPALEITSEEQAAFSSALENLHDFLRANVHGLVSQYSLGTREGFLWKGSVAERRFIAALPILEESGPNGATPKKLTSMPSVLSAPANMERMAEQSAPVAAYNLDFLPTFGVPSPPASGGSSPLHPLSQTTATAQHSNLRPPKPGTGSALDPSILSTDSPSVGRDNNNPFNSPTTRSHGSNPFDGTQGQNPFDSPLREPSAALQPILDKIPDLSFMLSDKLSEPAASLQAVPGTGAAQPRTSVDEWGDFSGQPSASQERGANPAIAAPGTSIDDWGNFSGPPSGNVDSTAAQQTVVKPRASLEEWGDFNG